MKKTIRSVLLFILALALAAAFALPAFAGETETTESSPTKVTEVSDFVTDTLKTTSHGGDVTGGPVTSPDGNTYYKMEYIGEGGDYTMQNAYTDIRFGTKVSELSYLTVDFDLSSDLGYFNKFNLYIIGRNEAGRIKGGTDHIYVEEEDGVYVFKHGNRSFSLGADPTEWHHISYVFFSEPDDYLTSKVKVFIDGEFFTEQMPLRVAETFSFGQLRLDIGGGAVPKEADIKIDNIVIKQYGTDYEGPLDNFFNGTYENMTEYPNAVFSDDYKLPTNAQALYNGVYYDTYEKAEAAASDGEVITLTMDPGKPIRVEKAVTVLHNFGPIEYYSSSYAPTAESTETSTVFAETSDKATVVWNFNGVDVPTVYSVGSVPIYYGEYKLYTYTEADGTKCVLDSVTEDGSAQNMTPLAAGETRNVLVSFITYEPKIVVEHTYGDDSYLYGEEIDLPKTVGALLHGDVLKLLSDFTVAVTSKLSVVGGSTISFDFNGHTLKYEAAGYFLNATVERTTVNVFSSRPGANYFTYSTNGVYTGALVNVNANDCTVNIGAVGGEANSNLTVYAPTLISVGSGLTGVSVDVCGVNLYKTLKGGEGVVVIRSGVAVLDGVSFYGIADGVSLSADGEGSRLVVKNSLLANVGGSQSNLLLRYANSAYVEFDNCITSGITTTVGNPQKVIGFNNKIVIKENCKLSSSIPADTSNYFAEVEGKILARATTSVARTLSFNTHGADSPDYTLNTAEYSLPTYFEYVVPEDTVTVRWLLNTDISVEVWKKGETLDVGLVTPAATDTVKYVHTLVSSTDSEQTYNIAPKPAFKVLANLTLYSKFDFNIYIPVTATDLTAVTFNSKDLGIASAEKVDVDGVECYKFSLKGLDYSTAGAKLSLNLTAGSVSMATTVSAADVIASLLENTALSADALKLASEAADYVISSCEKLELPPPAILVELRKEN